MIESQQQQVANFIRSVFMFQPSHWAPPLEEGLFKYSS